MTSPFGLIEECVGMMARQASSHGIEITTEVDSDLPSLHADRNRVLQVLQNLLENAVKFSPRGAPVHLSAKRAGDAVRFDVSDRGPGIEPDLLPFVFERFRKGSDRRSGAGLGLAIARGIVQAHGGEITVESRPGEGTTFAFTIPVATLALSL